MRSLKAVKHTVDTAIRTLSIFTARADGAEPSYLQYWGATGVYSRSITTDLHYI